MASLLIIPLIAGYAFADSWHGARYRIARATGYSLYFSAALYGAALLVMGGLVLLYLIGVESGFLQYLETVLGFLKINVGSEAAEVQTAAVSFLTLMLGLFGGHALNLIPGTNKIFLDIAVKDSDFERLVLRGIRRSLPMLVTLDNGKVYVGYVIRAIDPLASEKELRILPVFSGFRSKETGTVAFHTNYSGVLRQVALNVKGSKDGADKKTALSHLEIGDFEVVMPVSKIVTSTLYDKEAKEMFTEDRGAFLYQFPL
ncbi:hypothetical protein [Marinobacter alexandrii]|uniref:hypothetical protein n=1 Tax=Marinobacter alexandrii TaxID=2570351 RepID=UPI0032666148